MNTPQETTLATTVSIRSDSSRRLATISVALGLLTFASFLFFVMLSHRSSLQQLHAKPSLLHWTFALSGLVPYACTIGALITGRLAVRRIDASKDPVGARLARQGFFLGAVGLTLLFVLPLFGFAFFVLLSSGGTPH